MPEAWTQILYAIGILTALITALWAVFKGSKDSKATIDKQIDERMAKEIVRLDDDLKETRKELADAQKTIKSQGTTIAEQGREIEKLKGREESAVAEAHAVKRVVQHWWRVLKAWDRDGRNGPLPLPSDEDLHRLELSPATPPAGFIVPKTAT